MKKTIALWIVFFFVLMSFTSISGIQIDKNIIIPSGRGDILYVGGSGEGNYTKIQDAIDNASDGDTVFVYDDSSPYIENVIVDKSIDLIGEDRDTTIIDGNHISNSIRIVNSIVNVSGFTIKDGSINARERSRNIVISDNHFDGRNGFGISFWDADNSIIDSNTFINCDPAIYLEFNIDNVTISNNYFNYNTGEGYNGDIEYGGDNHVICNNTFINSNSWKSGCLRSIWPSNNAFIKENIFDGYEIAIVSFYGYQFDNTLISHNTFINNDCGIVIDGQSNRVMNNNFIKNSRGVSLAFLSGSNNIINNNFINNKRDASSTIFPRGNIWDGNYWDSWIGVKIPIPYFQQFPKIIWYPFNLGFAIDRHPAKQPYNYTTTQGCEIE